ncbi:MAG: FtsX-like permease family protein [Actinomycetota bacterium]
MSRAAMRACARVARRQAMRAPGRSALIVAMIAFPIAALTLGATLIRTSVPTLEEYVTGEMGSAELVVHPATAGDVDTPAIASVLPRGSQVVAIHQWNHTEVVNGSLVYATVWETSIPIDRPPLPGLYVLMAGRAPTRTGEAAVDPRVVDVYRVSVGDDIAVGGRTFHIVGIAARPLQMSSPTLVVAPGTLDRAAVANSDDVFVSSLLVDLPKNADLASTTARLAKIVVGSDVRLRGKDAPDADVSLQDLIATRDNSAASFINDAPVLTGVSFAGTTLALFATGLIAAAAFGVGIRRQLRMLGLVGATGGDPRHVRAVVLLGGTSLGIVGAGIGVALGIAGAFVATPYLYRFTDRLPGAVVLHAPTLLGAALLGVVAATLSALWPARIAARMSTLDALAARLPPSKPPGRLAGRGLIVSTIGAAVTAAGMIRKDDVLPAAGSVMMVGGFLVAVPLLMNLAGRLAARMPMASRLAVRDTARHGRRTATAIAAAALALMAPVSVGALSLSEEAHQAQYQWIGKDHILIGPTGSETAPREMLTKIRDALPDSITVGINFAAWDAGVRKGTAGTDGGDGGLAFVERTVFSVDVRGHSFAAGWESAPLFIGGADLLRALHAQDGIHALESGKIVGIGPGSVEAGVVRLPLPPTAAFSSSDGERIEVSAVAAGATSYGNREQLPGYVISKDAARRLGLVPGGSGPVSPSFQTLVAALRPLTKDQIRDVKEIAAAYPGMFVQTLADFLPQFRTARAAATGAAALIALGIVAITVALVSSESRRDHAIMVAVGAPPRVRRRIAAARAGLIALLASVIAVPAGFLSIAVIQFSRADLMVRSTCAQCSTHFPIVIPVAAISIVLLAVPLLASGWGWLASRRPKSNMMLQPLQ